MRRLPIYYLAFLLLGCSSPAGDVVVEVPSAPRVPPRYQVGEEVGRLLSPEPAVSKAAEKRLVALVGERRQEFLDYAATLEGEHDMRLLHVLDEHQALPDLTSTERLDFLLWKAALPERTFAMKAQSRLMQMARDDPAPLIGRLQRGDEGADVLGVALAVSGRLEAFPALLARYRGARTSAARAAAAEALGLLAGEERRPRASGSRAEIDRDAAGLADWYEERLEREAAAAAEGGVE